MKNNLFGEKVSYEHFAPPYVLIALMSRFVNRYQSAANAVFKELSFVSRPGTEMLMVPGMTFTIEPMVNMGTDRIFVDEENDWTIYTNDHKPSAQWEVQVLVTEDGCEVLTY